MAENTYEADRARRGANHARLNAYSPEQLRDVANWVNGYDSTLLEVILDDIDSEDDE